MKSFFTYHGAKCRLAKHYPAPTHEKIIEPFAGSAGYSTYFDHENVNLYDVDGYIFEVWKYLIGSTHNDIVDLPQFLHNIDDVRSLDIAIGAQYLIGYWFNKGTTMPCRRPSAWMASDRTPTGFWGPSVCLRIAQQVSKIKSWTISKESYLTIPNQEATWFIDPPYVNSLYRHKITDYAELADWCKSRKGQVIVCERAGTDWLPFDFLAMAQTTAGKNSKGPTKECIWYKED